MRHADTAIPGSLTSESLTVLAEGEERKNFRVSESSRRPAAAPSNVLGGVEIKEKSMRFSKTLLVLEFTCNGGFNVPNIKN